MAAPATIFHFKIDLSDLEQGVYEHLDFRVAQHPSESVPYLLTRILAYVLNVSEGADFVAGGLSDPDLAALSASDLVGNLKLLIEIGNPSPRRLHKASKSAPKVKVYTYKNPDVLLRSMQAEHVHRASNIEIYALAPEFLALLATWLDRENMWSVVYADGTLLVNAGTRSAQGELRQLSMSGLGQVKS